MPKFELIEIEEIIGKQKFYKLSIDESCQFDEYEEEIEELNQYKGELMGVFSLMEDIANMKSLPKTKFHELNKGSKDGVKEYEFKTKHLRVYAIKTTGGKIIVLGGYKNNQGKDLKRFQSIKKRYLNS